MNPPSPSVPASGVLAWDDRPVTPTPVGERRDFFDGPTATLARLECHATTLGPGQVSHPPHRHAEEELIVVREGTLEVTIEGRAATASAGAVVYLRSNDLHGLRNPGAAAVTYHVFQVRSPGSSGR